jgi:hypothetical protein
LQKRLCRLQFLHWLKVHKKNQVARPTHHTPHLSPDMAAHPSPTENAMKLSSLTQWSQEHVRAIFESPSNEEFIQAVEETFLSDIKATVNGKQVGRQEIKESVLSMRAESSGGLRVEWKDTVEVPQDTYNRVIFFEPRPRPSSDLIFSCRTDHSEVFMSFTTSNEGSREKMT